VQGRTLTAAPDVVEGQTHSELLLTQAFGPTGGSQQQQQQDAGAASTNTTAGVHSWPAAGAAAAAAGAVSGNPSVTVDPVLAQFGGRRSPARDRVLRASQDKQQQWQQQQERLQPGRRGTAAAAAAVQLDRGCLAAEGSGAWGVGSSSSITGSTGRQQQLKRHSLTPEPYLYSRDSTGDQGVSSSSGSSSGAVGYKGTAGLPLLPRGAAAAAAAGCEAHQGLLRDCAGAQLQQLACSITRAVNMQAAAAAAGTGTSTAAAAVGDAGEEGGAGAAGDRGRVQGGSALGLQGGELERLVARWAVWQAGLDDYTLSVILFCLLLDVQYSKHTSKGCSRLCRSASRLHAAARATHLHQHLKSLHPGSCQLSYSGCWCWTVRDM
jgi:hypothetical protein